MAVLIRGSVRVRNSDVTCTFPGKGPFGQTLYYLVCQTRKLHRRKLAVLREVLVLSPEMQKEATE